MKYAPQKVKSLLADNIVEAEQVDISNEALELAELYIQEGALGEKSVDDARHIALATVEGVSALISWNFKHMVNFLKIRQYNSINLREGYRTISIHTPREIVDV